MAAFPCSSPLPACASTPLRSTLDSCASHEIYGDAQARLTQWRKDVVSSASFDAQQGLRELCHERQHLTDLQSDLAGVQGLVEAASQLQAGGARLAEVLHSASAAATNRAQALAGVKEELQSFVKSYELQVQQEEHKIVQQQELADKQHDEALKLLSTYKERLGLAIDRVAPQTVRMAFSLLDEHDPEREFVFTLGLGQAEGSEGYCVAECIPQVPEMSKLLEELNLNASSATALPRFVCSMRRAFIRLSSAACAA